jgi:2-hydroxycyclohexanecarboxyl-CoA dehydrogenase
MITDTPHEITSRRFRGKVALVTGAGQGIGQATAFRLGSEGAVVGVLDKNNTTAAGTARRITEQGGIAVELTADVTEPFAVASCVDKLHAEFGRIDVLVNNAGFDRPGAFLKLEPEDFQAVWGVHFLGAVHCCRACAPLMMGQQDGRIVNVSSIYGRVGSKGESAYSSAKAALVALTKSLAREWGLKGIRVNAILPGLTDTPTIQRFMEQKYKDAIIQETALGRSAHPTEIAAAIAFLASDDASFITGATLEVTGGWNL